MKKLFLFFLMVIAIKSVMADDLTATITNTSSGLNNGAIDLTLNGGVAPFTYQWTGPGGFSSLDEDIADLQAGEYCVTVSDVYCGIATLCVVVEEDVTTGIIVQTASSMTIFPNPFSREFSVVFDLPAQGVYTFGLLDQNGKTVWTEKRNLETGKNACSFKLTKDIAAGKYELTIQGNGEGILTRSVVRVQ